MLKPTAKKNLESMLTERGIHPTSQRLALAHYLLYESDHPTVAEIRLWAKKNLARVSLATIYNTLAKFTASGLIREFRFPHTDRLIYDHNVDDHFHLYDEKRDRLVDLKKDEVEIRFRNKDVHSIRDFQLFVFGSLKPASALSKIEKMSNRAHKNPHKGE